VRELAARHGIRPSKSLGQNFLLDPNMARAIVSDAGVGSGDRVVEIGAGLGSLTRAIAEAGPEEVLAIEFDRSLLPALEEAVADLASVRVVHADATKLDWRDLLNGGTWVLCANLPYNVGTTIVLDVLENAPQIARLLVMLQREVGERLVAGPGQEPYGAPSVKVAYRARARLVRNVPPEVFWPRPSVGSVVVRLERLGTPAVDADEERLWTVVEEAFAQRRKTVRNALRRLGLEASRADGVLRSCSLDPAARAEELGLEDFARIAGAMP
jgi:16S rRNA (adenine1518-N6/adenine1519-N6)-dimethyltransferase